ncbi:hypothetical protein ATANTOWER_020064 [Ataeniobius toweri]|uniref:Uncharacterized protein n=1 Tax=Ataeniobius toweri TaxID=208326 RepID=A0ABU7C670_9TELE|nr:hypothetical protein [Ataeniobius toweri]
MDLGFEVIDRASTWLETESFSGFNHRHCRHIKPDGKHFTSPQGHVLTEPKPYGQQQLKWTRRFFLVATNP